MVLKTAVKYSKHEFKILIILGTTKLAKMLLKILVIYS